MRKTCQVHRIFLACAASILLCGCALRSDINAVPVQPRADIMAMPGIDSAGAKGPLADDQKPRFKSLSPVDTQLVSLSFAGEDYKNILQSLALAAGLNLVIDPGVDAALGGARSLTAEYYERPVRDVLDSVCQALDISWHESDGTIYVNAMAQKVFDLDFLGSVRQSNFNVGGDVLGGVSSVSSSSGVSSGGGASSAGSGAGGGGGGSGSGGLSGSAPLTGSFQVSGQASDTVTDIYKQLEDSIKDRIGKNGSFFLNRQTGTLLVRARPRIVDEIGAYLKTLRSKYRRQVLIDATLLEVKLTSDHELGVDWRNLEATLSRSAINPAGASLAITNTIQDTGSFYGIHLSQRYYDVTTVLHALKQYGQVKTLSNPRLKVMNGQSAMISVGQSVSYLKSLQQNLTSGGTGGITTSTTTAEIGSIFDGVLLGVTPVIEGDGFVTIHIVPIKTDLVSLEEREFTGGNRYTFPKVNLSEESTVLRVKSGDMAILGGLIQDTKENTTTSLPFLDRLPLIGPAFKYNVKKGDRAELVILMRVRVI